MKKFYLLLLVFAFYQGMSQSTNDILNVLISQKLINQEQADSLRADAAIKQQETDANKKSFLVTATRQIQLSALTQVRFQEQDEKGKKDGFDIRRARLDLKGNLTSFLYFRFQTEFAVNPKILDAYTEIRIKDYFNITVGQFRVPFSLENLTPVTKLEVIDYSQAVNAMVSRNKDIIGDQNGRDVGIQIGGGLWKKGDYSLLEYRLGIFNGSGINFADTANDAKDIGARLLINPIKGLSFGSSYYNGWGKAVKPTAEFIGQSEARIRFGLEASYTTDRLSLKGEFIQGKDGNTNRAGGYILAGYYIIPKKLQAVVKYDTYDADMAKNENITTNYVVGANFNFSTWSRLQAFYTFREEQGTSVNNNYFSVQFQIGF